MMVALALRQSSHYFFFNDTATTEIYTLSLHDALPIYPLWRPVFALATLPEKHWFGFRVAGVTPAALRVPRSDNGRHSHGDRKSTRLNSSHANISYAVFCLKKKN